ncbi:MAG: hypothetical protein JWP18_545 [Solirubrobacterales bacterium]|jgi:hypothetical protein|nr:hypothetical protein [Solirubrobacterales bacterium]
MSPAPRRTAGVILLALAGLVVAVALGVVVARSVSHSVALGGTDLGNGRNLVVTQTTVRTVVTTVATRPPKPKPKPVGTTPTTTTPAAPTGDAHGGGDDNSGSGKGRDHPEDD